MAFASERVFKLSNYPGSLGLSCGEGGLELAGVPLLNRTNQGFVVRPAGEIEHLVASAYGTGAYNDLTMKRLDAVACALNAGELAYAMTAAVLLRFPELDWNGAARIARADDLLKYDPNELRDWHGRWTTEGGGATAAPNVQLLSAPANDDAEEIATNRLLKKSFAVRFEDNVVSVVEG
jgi:hypothetical protein